MKSIYRSNLADVIIEEDNDYKVKGNINRVLEGLTMEELLQEVDKEIHALKGFKAALLKKVTRDL